MPGRFVHLAGQSVQSWPDGYLIERLTTQCRFKWGDTPSKERAAKPFQEIAVFLAKSGVSAVVRYFKCTIIRYFSKEITGHM
jgi:hypothetical protein